MLQKILRSCFILLSSAVCVSAAAQNTETKTQPEPKQKIIIGTDKEKVPVFCGLSVSVDLVGAVMKAINSDFAQTEAALRLNFKEKYFPVFELGYGFSDYVSEETDKCSKTNAPYMRIGMDYNFTKKRNGNRLYAGIRYGFSHFRYDLADASYRDPVWNQPLPFYLNGEAGNAQWGEAVFGLETRLWKFIQLGWNLRYKKRFSQHVSKQGAPWYLPGFGKNGSTCFGGTFNLIFEI
ncbi:DUF6048 family protein [Bacteroides eggerthii]|uniref:DUF6048 family protein n=1 Tax=Bacteroides eggerthii TaxID=28111 RepID=A0ABT7U7U8_9BACE|nr:DUF6048 family protein [Bacteroides eggerthii]